MFRLRRLDPLGKGQTVVRSSVRGRLGWEKVGFRGFTWVAFGLRGDVLWDWGQGAHNYKRQARDRCTEDRRAKTDEQMGAWKDGALHIGRQGKAVPVIWRVK